MSSNVWRGITADDNFFPLIVNTIANRPAASSLPTNTPFFAFDEGILYTVAGETDAAKTWASRFVGVSSVPVFNLQDFQARDNGGLDITVGSGFLRFGSVVTQLTGRTITLTDNATNFVELDPATPVVNVNTSAFTAGSIPIAEYVTSGGDITTTDAGADKRAWMSQDVPQTRTISTGEGLSGGGDLSANRTLGHDLDGLTDEATPANADLVLVERASDAGIRKVELQNLPGAGGAGDVVGPAGATDNAIARHDGTTGKLLQDSDVLIDDSENITGIATTNYVPQTAPANVEGTMYYDSDEKAMSFFTEGGNVNVNMGQEVVVRVRNSTGSQIDDGEAVYISGSTGTLPNITLVVASSDTPRLIGLATENIANNATGFVTTFGIVRGIDTSSFSAGDELFVDGTTPGALTATMPTPPDEAISVGIVVTSNPTTGKIFVNPGDGTRGVILHEKGGLEADVSAFAGVLSINGGTTADNTTWAAIAALLSGTLPETDGGTGQTTMKAAMEGTPIDFGVFNQQAAPPTNPAAGDSHIWFTDDAIPRPQYTDPASNDYGMLRFVPRSGNTQIVASGAWSAVSGVTGTVTVQSAQLVTYSGFSADEEAMLDTIEAGSVGQLWIRNTTRSQNVRVDSWATGSNQFTVDSDFDIEAWDNTDALTTELDLGNETLADIMYFSMLDDGDRPAGARLAVLQITVSDSGVIGAAAGAPSVDIRNIEVPALVVRILPAITDRTVLDGRTVPILAAGDAHEYTFGIRAAGTGSQTLTFDMRVTGYYVQ